MTGLPNGNPGSILNMGEPMRFGRYFITVRAEDDILLPGYLGSTLRGGFGTALKTSMCGNLSHDCGSCEIGRAHV